MQDIDTDVRERLNETCAALSRLAHAMNNPLTSLIGRAQLLRMGSGGDEKIGRAVQVIEESAARLTAHVQELGTLASDVRQLIGVQPTTNDAGDP